MRESGKCVDLLGDLESWGLIVKKISMFETGEKHYLLSI